MRRARVLGFLGAGVLCGLAPVAAARADVLRSTSFQGAAQHQGVVDDPALGAQLTAAWRSATPGFLSYPVVDSGLVLFTSRNDPDKSVWAVDETTGTVRWHAPISGYYGNSSLTSADGRVFVNNFSGDVAAYRVADGALLWSVTQDTSSTAGDHQDAGIPVAADGRLFETMHVNDPPYFGVQAFAADTGAQVWAARAPQDIQGNAPAVLDGKLLVNVGLASTAAFDTASGAAVWQAPMSDGEAQGLQATTTATDGTVIATATEAGDDPISAQILDAVNGHRRFAEDPALDGPAIAGGLVLQHTAARLWATDEHTGTVAWSWSPAGTTFSTPPLVTGRYVRIGTAQGTVETVDLGTGTQVSTTNVGAPVGGGFLTSTGGPPAGLGAGDGMLFVPTTQGVVALKGESQQADTRAPDTSPTVLSVPATATRPTGMSPNTRARPALLHVPSRIGTRALHDRGLALLVRLPASGGNVLARLTFHGHRFAFHQWHLETGGRRVLRLRGRSQRAFRGAALLTATLTADGTTRNVRRRVTIG